MTIEQNCARGGRPQAIVGKNCVFHFAQRVQGNSSPTSLSELALFENSGE